MIDIGREMRKNPRLTNRHPVNSPATHTKVEEDVLGEFVS